MPAHRLKIWGLAVLLGLGICGAAVLTLFAARLALRQAEIFVTFRMKALIRAELEEHQKATARRLDLALLRRAADESAGMVIREMRGVRSYPDKFALLRASIERCDRSSKGLYCEFGVYKGETINFIASLVPDEVHGFDSFEGLPENWWGMFQKGMFSLPGLPSVRPNVRLHKGWFKDSLPGFRARHPEALAFAHLDADLYASSKDVLDLMGDRILPGTVLQFDEYMNYPGWQEGEYKAFQEFARARHAEFEYIGFANEQVSVRITRIAPLR